MDKIYADIREFAVKIRDSIPRLAGLMARLEKSPTVTSDHIERAHTVARYYLSHATAVVESWSGAPLDLAGKILAKVEAGKLGPDEFTVIPFGTLPDRGKLDYYESLGIAETVVVGEREIDRLDAMLITAAVRDAVRASRRMG